MDAASPYLLRPWIGQYGPIAASLTTPAAASLPAMAAQVVERFSSRIAFTTVLPNGLNGSLSYAQVGEMSDAFAAYLREVLRLASGTRVAIQMPNCLAYPVALLGIPQSGLCRCEYESPLHAIGNAVAVPGQRRFGGCGTGHVRGQGADLPARMPCD